VVPLGRVIANSCRLLVVTMSLSAIVWLLAPILQSKYLGVVTEEETSQFDSFGNRL